jgi:hypothetical protein
VEGETVAKTKEQQHDGDEYEYLIVKRRKRRRGGFRPREERAMETWERAVLDVFSNNEVRGQMLWEAGRVKLDHLKRVMVKAEVSNIKDVMDELWSKLAHQSDEAQENRPYREIETERCQKSAELQKRIDEFYAESALRVNALTENNGAS